MHDRHTPRLGDATAGTEAWRQPLYLISHTAAQLHFTEMATVDGAVM